MASCCHIGVADGGFGDGFGDDFMREGVKSVLVVLILSFASFWYSYHTYIGERSQIGF